MRSDGSGPCWPWGGWVRRRPRVDATERGALEIMTRSGLPRRKSHWSFTWGPLGRRVFGEARVPGRAILRSWGPPGLHKGLRGKNDAPVLGHCDR